MRFWISLCVFTLAWPGFGLTETSKHLIELLPTGCINWTKGILEARGECALKPAMPENLGLQAHQLAIENALNALKLVRLDATRNVAQIMSSNDEIDAKVRQAAEKALTVQELRHPDGKLEVMVRVDLLGGFAQFMLPGDIKQVESIKSVRVITASPPKDTTAVESVYTGLIVDARGIGAKPAMVPLLIDESGRQVYGSAFVSREYAVQYGMCEYVRSVEGSNLPLRIAPTPITVKGLRTLSERSCDIIISNADAARLRDASANLGFLKQCRVIIVLD